MITLAVSGGGGGILVFLWHGDVPFFRGTFFRLLQNYGFHNFQTFDRSMGILFMRFFIISGVWSKFLFDLTEWP